MPITWHDAISSREIKVEGEGSFAGIRDKRGVSCWGWPSKKKTLVEGSVWMATVFLKRESKVCCYFCFFSCVVRKREVSRGQGREMCWFPFIFFFLLVFLHLERKVGNRLNFNLLSHERTMLMDFALTHFHQWNSFISWGFSEGL